MKRTFTLICVLVMCACGGKDGTSSLVRVSDEDPGGNCDDGGQKIDYGVDTNGSGVLDSDEVDGTSYVCNGAIGADGSSGTNGADGMDGMDGTTGTNGADGLSAVIRSTPEPAGVNCLKGGAFVEYGTDDDGNGVLDDPEVDGGNYVCNGESPDLVGAGIQRNISLANVEAIGWQICAQALYNQPLNSLPATCDRTNIMVACREVANPNNLVLAAADTSAVVTTVDGTGQTDHHVSNGVGWYYTPDTYSWGFFRAGDGVRRSSCDTEPINPDDRLCWHTTGGGTGYRCGATINFGIEYEKLILHKN